MVARGNRGWLEPEKSPCVRGWCAITSQTIWRQSFELLKLRLHTAINRADFVSWCMLYTYKGNKMHSVKK